MSSDDEDLKQPPGRQYLIAKKPWRSAELTEFLRTLDRLAVKLRLEKRGQPARFRIDVADRLSESMAVPGLPKNAYLDSWVKGLPAWKKALLDIKDEIYDFTFPDWVHE